MALGSTLLTHLSAILVQLQVKSTPSASSPGLERRNYPRLASPERRHRARRPPGGPVAAQQAHGGRVRARTLAQTVRRRGKTVP